MNAKRFGLLIKKDALESYRSILIAAGAVFGAFLIIYIISMLALTQGGNATYLFRPQAHRNDLHYSLFANLLFIGGFIVTSRAFMEVHNRVRNHDWFMLPASPLEKFVERVVLTSVGYALICIVLYTLFSLLAAGISQVIFRTAFPVFNPFNRTIMLLSANYLAAQSIFLLGAAYFKKTHFLKTVALIIGFAIVLGILAAVSVRLVFADYFRGMVPTGEFERLFNNWDYRMPSVRMERLFDALWVVVKIIYWAVIGPLFWTIAFIRLRETEVKDGV